jgi:hypothetical protein
MALKSSNMRPSQKLRRKYGMKGKHLENLEVDGGIMLKYI